MQFVSLESQPIDSYLSFYRTKFIQAFKAAPEDPEDKTPVEEWEWISADKEKAYKQFLKEMDKAEKDKNPITLLNVLFNFRQHVLDLPLSSKADKCSVQKFYLYLLPLFILEGQKKSKDIFT